MSVIEYWKSRLKSRDPFFSKSLRLPRVNYKDHRPFTGDTWPRAIVRQAMFADYLAWHEDAFLAPYRNMPFYEDREDKLPKAVDELAFFTTMAPWVYIVGKKQQVRAYAVPTQKWHESEWVKCKVNKYFIRLCEWEDHVAVFELLTGLRVSEDAVFFDVERAKRVSEVVEAHLERIKNNREKLNPSMVS